MKASQRLTRISGWVIVGAIALGVQAIVHIVSGPRIGESLTGLIAAVAFVAVGFEAFLARQDVRKTDDKCVGLRTRIALALNECDTYASRDFATVPISVVRFELDPDWEDQVPKQRTEETT